MSWYGPPPEMPGQPPQQPGGMPWQGQPAYAAPPDNYLVWAILSTVLCCWPLGVPAIIFSNQVNTKWMMGDVAGAHEASRKAKLFSIWAVAAHAALIVVILLFYIGLFATLIGVVANTPASTSGT